MFLLTTASQILTELHQMDEEKWSTIFEPNIEDLWTLEIIGVKPHIQNEQTVWYKACLKILILKKSSGILWVDHREKKIQIC